MTQLSWFSTSGLRFFFGRIASLPADVIASGWKNTSLPAVMHEKDATVIETRARHADDVRRTGNKQMQAKDLVAMRVNWGLSQDCLADRLRLPRQAYVEMEAGRRSLKKSHLLALEEIGIDLCLIKKDVTMLIPQVRSAMDYLDEHEDKPARRMVHAEAAASGSWSAGPSKLQ